MEDTSRFEDLCKNQRIILKIFLKNIMLCFQDREALQALAYMVIKLLLEQN
jgi:hypothetical protein